MANWQLKRDDTNETIAFDQDMQWLDEFDWSALAQANPVMTIGGAVHVQQSTKLAGRRITLGGEWVWLERGDLEKLQSWTAVPKLRMTLTHYDGRTFAVIFRTHDTALDCEPVLYQTPEPDDAPYTGQIRLMTI